MVALFYLVLSCNLQKLSYCLWWRQTDIITGAWTTVLTRDILPNLTTEAKIFVLQAIIIQMGCCSQDQLTKIDQFYTPFYSNMMKWSRYLHIPQFMHFTDNKNGDDKTRKLWLWKMWDIFEILNRTFSKFYNPSENLAVGEVTVLFKGTWVSNNIFPRSKIVLVSNYRIYVTWLDTPMTWKYTWGRTGNAWHNSWQ